MTTFTIAAGIGYVVGEIWLRPRTQLRPAPLAIRPRPDSMQTVQPVAAASPSYAPSAVLSATSLDSQQARIRTSASDAPPAMPLIVVQLVDAAMALQPGLAKPAGTPSKSSVPAPTSVVPGPVERFHVQLGSFEERADANVLFVTLRDRGYAAHLVGGPPYVVRVGGYLDEPTAKRLAATLRAAGFEPTLNR